MKQVKGSGTDNSVHTDVQQRQLGNQYGSITCLNSQAVQPLMTEMSLANVHHLSALACSI